MFFSKFQPIFAMWIERDVNYLCGHAYISWMQYKQEMA